MIKGAGGTPGGVLHFIAGLAMMLGGLFLFANNIIVTSGFGFGSTLYNFGYGGYGISAGALFISFIVGIGMLFFNGRSLLGWVVTLGSLGAIFVGVIMTLHVGMRTMSLLDIVLIFVLIGGGLGFTLKSFKSY